MSKTTQDTSQVKSIIFGGFLWLLAGLLVLGGLYFIWWAVEFLINEVNKEVSAAIFAGVGSVIAVILSQHWQKKREIDEEHRDKKRQIYKTFLDQITKILRKTNTEEGIDLDEGSEDFQELMEFYYSFTSEVILWGSSEVITAYKKFRLVEEDQQENILIRLDNIFRAMRKDLGHSDWGLQQGELIKLFLKDPEEVEKIMET